MQACCKASYGWCSILIRRGLTVKRTNQLFCREIFKVFYPARPTLSWCISCRDNACYNACFSVITSLSRGKYSCKMFPRLKLKYLGYRYNLSLICVYRFDYIKVEDSPYGHSLAQPRTREVIELMKLSDFNYFISVLIQKTHFLALNQSLAKHVQRSVSLFHLMVQARERYALKEKISKCVIPQQCLKVFRL